MRYVMYEDVRETRKYELNIDEKYMSDMTNYLKYHYNDVPDITGEMVKTAVKEDYVVGYDIVVVSKETGNTVSLYKLIEDYIRDDIWYCEYEVIDMWGDGTESEWFDN